MPSTAMPAAIWSVSSSSCGCARPSSAARRRTSGVSSSSRHGGAQSRSSSSRVRWSATAKLRISSTSSPQNSTRTGCSSVGGKTSTMPPRTANSPRFSTRSTRVYAASARPCTTCSRPGESPGCELHRLQVAQPGDLRLQHRAHRRHDHRDRTVGGRVAGVAQPPEHGQPAADGVAAGAEPLVRQRLPARVVGDGVAADDVAELGDQVLGLARRRRDHQHRTARADQPAHEERAQALGGDQVEAAHRPGARVVDEGRDRRRSEHLVGQLGEGHASPSYTRRQPPTGRCGGGDPWYGGTGCARSRAAGYRRADGVTEADRGRGGGLRPAARPVLASCSGEPEGEAAPTASRADALRVRSVERAHRGTRAAGERRRRRRTRAGPGGRARPAAVAARGGLADRGGRPGGAGPGHPARQLVVRPATPSSWPTGRWPTVPAGTAGCPSCSPGRCVATPGPTSRPGASSARCTRPRDADLATELPAWRIVDAPAGRRAAALLPRGGAPRSASTGSTSRRSTSSRPGFGRIDGTSVAGRAGADAVHPDHLGHLRRRAATSRTRTTRSSPPAGCSAPTASRATGPARCYSYNNSSAYVRGVTPVRRGDAAPAADLPRLPPVADLLPDARRQRLAARGLRRAAAGPGEAVAGPRGPLSHPRPAESPVMQAESPLMHAESRQSCRSSRALVPYETRPGGQSVPWRRTKSTIVSASSGRQTMRSGSEVSSSL